KSDLCQKAIPPKARRQRIRRAQTVMVTRSTGSSGRRSARREHEEAALVLIGADVVERGTGHVVGVAVAVQVARSRIGPPEIGAAIARRTGLGVGIGELELLEQLARPAPEHVGAAALVGSGQVVG